MNQDTVATLESILKRKLQIVYDDFSVKEKIEHAIKMLENCPEIDFDFRQFVIVLKSKSNQYDFNIDLNIVDLESLKTVINNINKSIKYNGHWQEKKCLACGENFFIVYEEALFFEERNFPIPKRCKNCRQERKVKH